MNNEQTVKWYGKKLDNVADQGLVIDEKTGENIAVCYNGKHANLIAASPEMLTALIAIEDELHRLFLCTNKLSIDTDKQTFKVWRQVIDAIASAKEV